jgi:hypothetical protein
MLYEIYVVNPLGKFPGQSDCVETGIDNKKDAELLLRFYKLHYPGGSSLGVRETTTGIGLPISPSRLKKIKKSLAK